MAIERRESYGFLPLVSVALDGQHLWTVNIFYVLGGIWFAQIVVYPLFGKVGEDEYVAYHRFYSSRIPLPVILPGFASFGAAVDG